MGLFGAEVPDGAVDQLEAGLDGVFADLADLFAGVDALDVGVGAKVEVELIGVVDQFLGKVGADQAGQVAAHLIGEAELAVREGACPRKAGGDGAGGAAVGAVAEFGLGTAALFDRLALFHQQNVLFAAVAQQLDGGKNAGRPRAHNDQIVFVHLLSP